jgi:hypothetical protein
MFADTRARDGATGVVREDAGADDGGIADASPLLIHKAADRRGGSEIVGSVARDSANGAELALVRLRMIKNNRLLFLRFSQLRDTRFGQEILSIFE